MQCAFLVDYRRKAKYRRDFIFEIDETMAMPEIGCVEVTREC